MQIGGIITLVLLTIGALWVVIRLGFGKNQEEVGFEETGLGKGYNFLKGLLQQEDKIIKEETDLEETLHKKKGQELRRIDLATQAANQMRTEGITKENATALYLTLQQDQEAQEQEEALVNKLEQDLAQERALLCKLPTEQRRQAIEALNQKGKLLRAYRNLQEQKKKKMHQIQTILQGWQQPKQQDLLAQEQQEVEQLLTELKALAVQEMQWHEEWKKEEQTQEAQLRTA